MLCTERKERYFYLKEEAPNKEFKICKLQQIYKVSDLIIIIVEITNI